MVAAQSPSPATPPNTPSPRPPGEVGTLHPVPALSPELPAPPVNVLPSPGRNVRALRPLASLADPADAPPKPKVNYRIHLEIKEGKESPMEISVVASEGKVRSQMINPKRVVIDDREIPSTLEFTATLSPLEADRCQLNLFLGRSLPYVTGKSTGPGGQTSSQYQQMHLGLDTTVILQVGKPLVIQSDSTQQVKVTLERVTE